MFLAIALSYSLPLFCGRPCSWHWCLVDDPWPLVHYPLAATLPMQPATYTSLSCPQWDYCVSVITLGQLHGLWRRLGHTYTVKEYGYIACGDACVTQLTIAVIYFLTNKITAGGVLAGATICTNLKTCLRVAQNNTFCEKISLWSGPVLCHILVHIICDRSLLFHKKGYFEPT